jgi:hypothetical protein
MGPSNPDFTAENTSSCGFTSQKFKGRLPVNFSPSKCKYPMEGKGKGGKLPLMLL